MSLDEQKNKKLFSVVEKSSENIENENLQKLKKVFPQFVKDGEIDFDAMQAFLKKEGVLAGPEKYGLNWPGKSNAFKAMRTPSTGTLVPEKDKSKNWDETENIFIEGDNLEVLKLLQKGYKEKIKMIYIDPPYNTGKDFVYKDNFTQGVSDYYEQTGQTKGGIKMTANTEKNGRYHSDWLTMMYPRLSLAYNLLREDGVIFVSIDDNEVANLRMVMDEIFGEENFMGQMVWHARGRSKTALSIDHEYILVYAKNLISISPIFKPTLGILPNWYGEYIERVYGNPDNDIRGEWRDAQHTVTEKKAHYTQSINKNTGEIILNKIINDTEWYGHNTWMYPPNTVKKLYDDNRLVFTPQKTGKLALKVKKFKKEEEAATALSGLIERDEISSRHGSEEFDELMNSTVFDYPKPVDLLKKIQVSCTRNSDIILDFFAGSGTTAHAVMDLNAEDGGNRKYICVQLPEITDESSEAYKAGYKNISEIFRERIRRAGDKINKGDTGFKSYKLYGSNYRKWNNISDDNVEGLLNQSKLFIESPLVDNFTPENVAHEIALKEGFDLNIKLTQDKGDLKAYVLQDENRRLFVTFSSKVTKENVEKLKPLSDDILVCFDNSMDDTDKVNVGRIINLKVI